ncbi:hypothetical protein [Streptomyces rubiginosohelvolus]|uniref:hypothetical protein n=1 Tax=Streptomyces rubiginosohelvolus TaxID=67362 RepID=UPI0035D74A86
MTQDAADGTQHTEQDEMPIDIVALVGALARLAHGQTTATLAPLVDDPTARLLKAFESSGHTSSVVKVNGEIVGRYTVNLTRGKFVVDPDNETELNKYADDHGGTEVIVRRNPTWEKALLNHARRVEGSDEIIDSRTGEVVPGLKYVPGGQPTGNVTFTWEGKTAGQNTLLAEWKSGALDHLVKHVPALVAGRTPSAENA